MRKGRVHNDLAQLSVGQLSVSDQSCAIVLPIIQVRRGEKIEMIDKFQFKKKCSDEHLFIF
jgi:hypothetical protein